MTGKYSFAALDPRNIPVAQEANEKIFSSGSVYGIEVTVPALAKRCVANIDPQHIGSDASLAAIEVALTIELPVEGIILATVRADIDSVGAMAIFCLRSIGERQYGSNEWSYLFHTGFLPDRNGTVSRIKLIVKADSFAHGGWPGPKPLPTRENPWPAESTSVDSTKDLAVIAAAVMDFKVPLDARVEAMKQWLLTGEEPKQYRDQVEKERLDMINALETGQIKVETRTNGRIAVVESTHRAGTSVGYCLAPVVVALNPEFRFAGGESHRKFTISAFEQKYADIKSALVELATMEAGWGGSPTIGGSPQGMSSKLTVDQVVAVVEKYLHYDPNDRPCNCGTGAAVMESHKRTPFCG